MQGKNLILLAASFFVLTLWGCGSSLDSGGDQTAASTVQGVVAAAGFAGSDKCVDCHEGFSWSYDIVAKYLSSAHVIHSTYISAASDAECLECHNPVGDGQLLEQYLAAENVPAGGLAAVGCEACHGSGAQHYGVGPFPANSDPTPDYDDCGQCHNGDFSHNAYHPFADNIVENYKMGAHFTTIERAHASEESISAKCSRCHSDQGFRQFYPQTIGLGRDEFSAILDPLAPLSNVGPVQCRTCHDPHSGELRVAAITDEVDVDGEDVEMTEFSASFRLCTACHLVWLDAEWDDTEDHFVYTYDWDKVDQDNDAGVYSAETDGRNNHYHGAHLDMVESHFDNPNTAEVEGFNINAGDEKACLNCHDAHGATKFEQSFAADIATEWGNEAGFHGDYQAEAFTYDFSSSNVCMACHSGTESVKITEGLGDDSLTAGENRVVACIACHDLTAKNDAGDAFELGARRIFKDTEGVALTEFTFPSGKMVTIEDGTEENILCLYCHSGRESKVSVDEKIAASAGPYTFTNIHYRAAAATLYGSLAQGAYEFDGEAYSPKLEHVQSHDICIECHNAHDGRINVDQPFDGGPEGCNTCHTNIIAAPLDPANYGAAIGDVRDIRMDGSLADYDGDGNKSEGIYYEVEGLKTLLLAAIQNYAANTVGVAIQYDGDVYPYFFKSGAISYSNSYGDFDAPLLQAAYNYQVSQKDPGVYAHNPSYIIQILYDSIAAVGGNVTALTRDDAGHFDSAGEPFRYWDEDGEMSTTCARCHSSEGGAYYIDNREDIADFERQDTKGISSGLACETCHEAPFDGTLRDVSAPVEFPSGATADLGDNSNLCMLCHQGRESGVSIDEKIAADPVGPYSFVNRHYFAAAAIMFGTDVTAGYEYATRTYVGQNTFAGHSAINRQTCIECHKGTGSDHSFIPPITTCACHFSLNGDFDNMGKPFGAVGTVNIDYDGDGTKESFQHEIDGMLVLLYEAMQDYAANTIGTGIIYSADVYPYFFKDTDGDNVADPGELSYGNRFNLFDASLLKAAYNYKSGQDPCSDMHNYKYVLQTLYDSIDDLNDGNLDNDVAGTAVAAIRP